MQPEPDGDYTWQDYLRWDTDERWELIEGRPCAMGAPSVASPIAVKLSDRDAVQPDILVVCRPEAIQRTHIEGAPDLVVEVLSPSTYRHDRVKKMNLYGRSGVPEYWMVTPWPLTGEVFSNREGVFTTGGSESEKLLRSVRFPGLVLDLEEIAAVLPDVDQGEEVHEGYESIIRG